MSILFGSISTAAYCFRPVLALIKINDVQTRVYAVLLFTKYTFPAITVSVAQTLPTANVAQTLAVNVSYTMCTAQVAQTSLLITVNRRAFTVNRTESMHVPPLATSYRYIATHVTFD